MDFTESPGEGGSYYLWIIRGGGGGGVYKKVYKRVGVSRVRVKKRPRVEKNCH